MTIEMFLAALEYAYLNCQEDERFSAICKDVYDAIKDETDKRSQAAVNIYVYTSAFVSTGKPIKERKAAFRRIVDIIDALDCFGYDVPRKELQRAVKYMLFTYYDYLNAII